MFSESYPQSPTEIKKPLETRTKRLAVVCKASLKPIFSEIKVFGYQNLDKLPKDRPIIFATTHLSNTDVTIAASELATKYNIKIVQASTHDYPMQSPSGYISKIVGGNENFISIRTKKVDGKEKGFFRPEDYEPMVEHLRGGPILMAAYYNSDKKYVDDVLQSGVVLPEKGGVGAIWLAQKSKAIIVPTAIDINKKLAVVNFGEALDLEKIDEIDLFKNDLEKTRMISEKLREQSDLLMSSLAKMLPVEKRGRWNN